MNISLTDELKEFVDRQVEEGAYTSTSEYIRQLVRERRELEAARQELRDKIVEGLNSPLSEKSNEEIHAAARLIARGRAAA